MVRHPQPLPSSTKRNRITFKTRLKLTFGDHCTDNGLVDEEEEKNRFLQRVAGVDQEDANEHHLQQVLTAAEKARTSTSGSNKSGHAAYIPTPDSNGTADNHEQLYPTNRYKDPYNYVCLSRTVEESTVGGLAHGITYYMDEKDAEWLNRNNEEARGEGTSAQAAVCSARVTSRSIKAKGKEAESCVPVKMSEDVFELVMGLFELITHEETEYLHHSLEGGMTFPEFSNYQDVFANPLSPTLFALFEVPGWIPQPPQMLRLAQLIYPYWKERRLERGGHRIIPTLNADEADTLNESYVCFRQREVKAIRKTRASQTNPTEKLTALQKQLQEPLELAQKILKREGLKRESVDVTSRMWMCRVELVNLKRKNPALGSKGDDDLLVDKEKPPTKKHERSRHHSKRDAGSTAPTGRPDATLRPSHRVSIVATEIETAMQRRKELDQDWENAIDSPYISPLVSSNARLFKYVPPSGTPPWPAKSPPSSERESDPESAVQSIRERRSQPVRVRMGRGGRMMVDRRQAYASSIPNFRARKREDEEDDTEVRRKLAERWRFDIDDTPLVPPEGSEEQDRMLVDDYDQRYMRHTIRIAAEVDPVMVTDPSLIKQTADGKREIVIPYKIGGPQHPVNLVPPARVQQPPVSVPISTPHQMSAATLNTIRKATSFRPPASAAITTNGSSRPAMSVPYIESPTKTDSVQENHIPVSHAQLKSAFASGEMAKYVSPALRAHWLAQQPAESPILKATPTVPSSLPPAQSY